jgi:hypothetical protein
MVIRSFDDIPEKLVKELLFSLYLPLIVPLKLSLPPFNVTLKY